MPATTPIYSLPYQQGADPPDGPSLGEDLALAVEAILQDLIEDYRGIPAGTILATGGASADTGFLLCDGSVVSQSTYAALFAKIGTSYNTGGEGAGNFRLPNGKGRFLVGLDAAQTEFDALGETGGAKTVTLTTGHMPAHSHTDGSLTVASHTHSFSATTASGGDHSHTYSGTTATETQDHTHAGTTNTETQDHSHGVSVGPSSGYSVTREVSEGSGAAGTIWVKPGIVTSGRPAMYVGAALTGQSGGRSAAHNHSFTTGGRSAVHNHGFSGTTSTHGGHTHGVSGTSGATSPDVAGNTGSAGDGGAHPNLPPYLTVNYQIKT